MRSVAPYFFATLLTLFSIPTNQAATTIKTDTPWNDSSVSTQITEEVATKTHARNPRDQHIYTTRSSRRSKLYILSF